MKIITSILMVVFSTAWLAGAADFFVDVDSFGFTPSTQQIAQGDTVTWVSADDQFHDIRSDSGAWTTGYLYAMGETYTLRFNAAGTYRYRSQLDNKAGTIVVTAGQASNAPPTIVITTPVAGATFNGSNAVVIVADATDDKGVTAVEFFVGTNLVGSAAVSPYQVTNNFLPGNYTLTAVARDADGSSTVSAPVNIVVRHVVTYQNFTFTPALLTVALGDTVIFTNRQGPHSVTGYDAEPFCGPTLTTAGGTCIVTFNTAGSFRYRCVPHSLTIAGGFSGMVGSVKVVGPPDIKVQPNSLALSGAEFSFQVDGLVVGKTNLVQFSSSLNSWTTALTTVATNSSVIFRDSTATSPFRFYRVVQLP